MAQTDQNSELQIHIPGMEQFKDLEFVQSETNPADLVVKLPDGSEVVFPNYIPLAQAGAPPAITLDDGTVIPGQEIVSLIDNLDYDLIAPAAGDTTAGLVTPGNASFSADPSGPLGDDIGHGPYAGGVQIADNTEPTQVPGYVDEGSDGGGGGGGEIPEILIEDNNGDYYGEMLEKLVETGTDGATGDHYNRPVDPGDFSISLRTEAPTFDDWDGISVELRAGETITITQDPSYLGQYYIGLDTDGNAATGTNPLPVGLFPLGWEYVTTDGSISYTATSDGIVYIGTGFEGTEDASGLNSPVGSYYTQIVVDSDNELTGTSQDDILVGGDGDEVLTGGAGDDLLTGGAGSDEFIYTDVTSDGDDTITDFVTGSGNDVVNLDALFDALSIDPGLREAAVHLSNDGSDTTLEINGHSGFSVVLEGLTLTDADVHSLVTDGNIVVDES